MGDVRVVEKWLARSYKELVILRPLKRHSYARRLSFGRGFILSLKLCEAKAACFWCHSRADLCFHLRPALHFALTIEIQCACVD